MSNVNNETLYGTIENQCTNTMTYIVGIETVSISIEYTEDLNLPTVYTKGLYYVRMWYKFMHQTVQAEKGKGK